MARSALASSFLYEGQPHGRISKIPAPDYMPIYAYEYTYISLQGTYNYICTYTYRLIDDVKLSHICGVHKHSESTECNFSDMINTVPTLPSSSSSSSRSLLEIVDIEYFRSTLYPLSPAGIVTMMMMMAEWGPY
jgi:hypothetical protein